MTKIRLDVFEGGTASATITIPVWVIRGASKMLPKLAGKELRDHIDVDRIVKMTREPEANGLILDIEDHAGKERVVISIVRDE
jgi:hypothetical protein